MKAHVIGSGIAGLASAVRLAVKGYQVSVFEANSYPGGKLTAFTQDGFRFDAGPSLFTLPKLVDELFQLAGKNPADHFQYEQLDESCRYFWEDGARLTAWADRDRFCEAVDQELGGGGAAVRKQLDRSARMYDAAAPMFMQRSLHKLNSYFTSDLARALMASGGLNLFTSMHEANQKRFDDPRLVQLFDRFATYNGSDPYRAPGILNMIPHLEHNLGTWFPRGGMHAITQSVVKLARELGVDFHFNAPVEKILIEDKRAVGMQVNGTVHRADLVVCNMDVVPAYRKLLKDQPAPEKTLEQERSGSALIFYWGINRSFEELGLHNIFFSSDYETEFKTMFEERSVYHDPTVYIHISSKEEKSDAPPGKENWFVMVNAPANYEQDWPALIEQVKANILAKVSRMLGTDIQPLIETEDVLDPVLIEKRTSSFRGALYGAASNDRQAAFLRHPNFSRNLKDLYFCGGSVHPGGGIPLALLSAKIVSDLIPSAS